MSELDVFGALTGTDKSSSVSWGWDYLRHYEELFSRWRYSHINLIEIGVAGGASLAAWERYFDRATLVGIDVNPDVQRFAQGRVFIRVGSQEDAGFLHGVAAAFPPTIVIDDGSHLTHHMIASFEALFPALLPGGVYVFEDLAFHFEVKDGAVRDVESQRGPAKTSMFEYLSRFMRARAANVAQFDGSWGFTRYAMQHIDQITIAGGLVAVRKRAPRDIDGATAPFERELQNPYLDYNQSAVSYAAYLMRHDVNLERANTLLLGVVNNQPGNEAAWNLYFSLMMRLGWTADALSAARRLTDMQPQSAEYFSRLSVVEELSGNAQAALDAARWATQYDPGNQSYQERVKNLEGK